MRLRFIILLSLLLKISIHAQIDLEQGLVAYYPFNNFAEDESQFGNDAIKINEVQFVSDEINGLTQTVASFNGIDSYIEIPHASQINFSNEEVFTISLWVNIPTEQLDVDGTVNDIMHKWTNAASEPYPFSLRVHNQTSSENGVFRANTFQGDLEQCNTPTGIVATSSSSINNDQWNHIIFSRDSDRKIRLYVNCELEFEVESTFNCTTENLSNLVLGMRETNGQFTRAFRGKLDELRIYNRVLTSDEINLLCTFTSSAKNEYNWIEEKVKLFPNPILRGFPIKFQVPSNRYVQSYKLYNSKGKLTGVYTPQDSIVVPSGVYILAILMDNGAIVHKQLVVSN